MQLRGPAPSCVALRLQKADALEKKLRGVMQLLGPEAQDKKLQHIDERLKGRESLGGFTADTMQLMLQRLSREFSLSTFPGTGITNECNETLRSFRHDTNEVTWKSMTSDGWSGWLRGL